MVKLRTFFDLEISVLILYPVAAIPMEQWQKMAALLLKYNVWFVVAFSFPEHFRRSIVPRCGLY